MEAHKKNLLGEEGRHERRMTQDYHPVIQTESKEVVTVVYSLHKLKLYERDVQS